MPSRGQNGGAMNDSLAQQSEQTPSPSTGSRQATHKVGNAMSSVNLAAFHHVPRVAVSAFRKWAEMERADDASTCMRRKLAPVFAVLKGYEYQIHATELNLA
jgi:hypothetical protein